MLNMGEPVKGQKSYGRGLYPRFIKRLLDLLLGIISLPFIGIAHLVIALLIRSDSKGPILYSAPRVGQHGRSFIMYKYRTMYPDSPDLKEPDGSTYNAPDDPRLTRFGAILRRNSLDELPQVINVLKGDMSFIGPRPDLAEEVACYDGEEQLKLDLKPGMSGYAQVYGRNAIPWHDRLALDVFYVKNQSFALDTKVFFKTFVAVIAQEGVFQRDSGE